MPSVPLPSGFSGSYKVPGFKSEVRYAQGGRAIGAAPNPVLLAGLKAPSGATAADNEVYEVIDEDEALAAVGYRSELAQMIRASSIAGVKRYLLCIPDPAGTAATMTITFAGTSTTAGTLGVKLDDHQTSVGFASGTTAANAAAAFVARLQELTYLFCTASAAGAVVTLTTVNTGARMNAHFCYLDKTAMAAGLTVTITGTATSSGSYPFTGGASVESYATPLAAVTSQRFGYSAWALNDTVSLAAVLAHGVSKAGPFGAGTEFMVFGHQGTESAAVTFSKAGNQAIGQVVNMVGMTSPAALAANMAAYRAVSESSPVTVLGNPMAMHNNQPLVNILPYPKDSSSPAPNGGLDVALNGGVTPLRNRNGQATIVRSITMRSLDGANPDYRVLDTNQAVVPQRIREFIDVQWEAFAVANPTAGPDLPDGAVIDGLATPSTWQREILAYLKSFETTAPPMLRDVDSNPPVVVYNTTLNCLTAAIPTRVARLNHQGTAVIQQI